MEAAGPILLCAGDPAAVDDVKRPLEEAGHVVRSHVLSDALVSTPDHPALVVLDSRRCEGPALHFCRRFRSQPAEGSTPLLFVLGDGSAAARLASLDAGADAYLLRPFASRELLAQIQTLLRTRQLQRRLTEKTTESQQTSQRLRQAYRQIDQDLAVVRQIQRSFLPRSLPEVPGASLAVHYHPCGQVGGDCHDAFRLDERNIGFYVADALGHGTPAGLLTMFLQRCLQGKEVNGNDYRLVPPGEVLRRINHDLMEKALAEIPFVTMVYALYDCRDRVLRFARAGHPHPIYVPRNGAPEIWSGPGNLLGVFSTEFAVQTRTLRPGDKVILHTDGFGSMTSEQSPDSGLLLECAARHRQLPIPHFVEQLSRDLLTQTNPADDFTLLGLEVAEI